MTLIQVIDAARAIVKEPLPSTRTFPDDTKFFKDSDMTDWYNFTQHEIQNRLVQTFENWFVTSTSIDIVAGTSEYSMPTDTLKIVRVEQVQNTAAPVEVYPMSINDKDKFSGFRVGISSAGDVSRYAIVGNRFLFRPIPSRSLTAGVKVFYTPKIPNYSSASSISIIPTEYHEALVWGVAKRALIQAESTPEALSIAVTTFNTLMNDMSKSAENRQVQRSRKVKRRKYWR